MALLSFPTTNTHFKHAFFAHNKGGNNASFVIRRVGVPSARNGFQVLNSVKTNGSASGAAVEKTQSKSPAVEETPAVTPVAPPAVDPDTIKRSDFPADFFFGAGSSALQTEGAYNLDGKGLSVWDQYLHDNQLPNADVAIDSYHRFKEDIQLLKDMGVKTYRFSIPWPRILPKGNLKGGINQVGIDHYNEVIDELISNGIEPFVTLFHFDSPQALQDQYGGFLSRKIVNDFKDYCDICFENFGDRIKSWTLINEPSGIAQFGYGTGFAAPGRASLWYNKQMGNSAREPYVVAHHLLLAHGAASKLYKEKYKAAQGGEIGIALVGNWFLPHSDSLEDQEAADRIRDFNLGSYLGPLINGEYPTSMKYLLRDRLPTFTDEEKEMIKGSTDFIGLNYYTSSYVRGVPITNDPPISYSKDVYAETVLVNSAGVSIGPTADGSSFINIYPDGLREILLYVKEKYQDPKLVVTENGVTKSVLNSQNHATAFRDRFRVKFMKDHLYAVKQAIDGGANVKGYIYWSLMDSFELGEGYNVRFGLNFTDFNTLAREPNYSAEWYAAFLQQ